MERGLLQQAGMRHSGVLVAGLAAALVLGPGAGAARADRSAAGRAARAPVARTPHTAAGLYALATRLAAQRGKGLGALPSPERAAVVERARTWLTRAEAPGAARRADPSPHDLRTRAAAASILLAAADQPRRAPERRQALSTLLEAAEREPQHGLRGQLYLDLDARQGAMAAEERSRLEALRKKVLPERPPYEKWDLSRGLKVRQTVHEEFWGETLDGYRAHGFHLSPSSAAGGRVTAEKTLRDPSGRNPPLSVRVTLRKGEVDLFRDADDPDAHLIIYSGHSALGGNVSMSVASAPPARGAGKLIQMYMCRGAQNLEEIRRHFGDDVHVVTSLDASESESDDRRLFAMYDTIARRGSYAATRRLAGRSAETRYLYPDDRRRLELVDADHDGVQDGAGRSPRALDRLFETGPRVAERGGRNDLVPRAPRAPLERLDGDKIDRSVAFANTVFTYHVEDTPRPRYHASQVQDRFVAAGWFDGPPGEVVRMEKVPGSTGKIGVRVNARFAGQSRDALGALVLYDMAQKLAAEQPGRRGSGTREQVLRPYLFASLYVHYMTERADVADEVLSNLARRVGLPPTLDYGKMQKVIESHDDGYASDGELAALERLTGGRSR